MEWNAKILKKGTVFSKNGGKTTLICGGKQKNITLKKGQKLTFIW
jgi:alpha-L-fucosidase 2